MPLVNGPAWLFCPADRPERFAKAAAAADVVILDLEDGAGDKPAARDSPGRYPAGPGTHRDPDQRRPTPASRKLDLRALARPPTRR